VDGILFEQDRDESCGGDGDEGSDDPGKGCSEEESNEDSESHEIDAVAHDAWGEDGTFDVGVDEIEDEDAEHLGPGVERGDECGEGDGDDCSHDGNDVEETHEETEEDEVADVQESEDDDAGDSEDHHEGELADEPLAYFALGAAKGLVEALALDGGEEREEEAVCVLAFEHEIDAEEGGGDDVDDVREPVGEGGKEIAGSGIEGSEGAMGEGVDVELVGEGEFADFRDDFGDALGKVGGEVAEIAQDRRKADGEEEREDEENDEDEDDDGDCARGLVVADFDLCDAAYGRHENDGEESADVEDEEFFFEGVGERQ
jgi:hypothetical protein